MSDRLGRGYGMDDLLGTRDQDHRDGDQRDRGDNRVWADEERLKALQVFRQETNQAGLPAPPHVPGYHSFWASTTNDVDSIVFRLRIGYTFITPEEVGPEWQDKRHYDAANPGKIVLKELIAMKLPLELFEIYMRENHHDRPLKEEIGVVNSYDALNETMRRSRARAVPEDDVVNMVDRRRPPRFASDEERR